MSERVRKKGKGREKELDDGERSKKPAERRAVLGVKFISAGVRIPRK